MRVHSNKYAPNTFSSSLHCIGDNMSTGDWCLVESDPGVFTELIREFGVQGAQVEELWSLDEESFENLKPVHGLIFLYKWRAEEQPQGSVVMDSRLDEIFFAKQVIKNACATLAILNLLLNTTHLDMALGSTLTEFKEFTIPLDPANRGLALTNSDHIRKVHNSFSRQQMFEFDEQLAKRDDDVFHFVAYVPINGRLYELDGLKDGPIDLGKCDDSDWLKTVKPVLDQRIQSYTSDEIHFNLMAIVSDRKLQLEKEIASCESQRDMAAQRIQAVLGGEVAMEDSGGLPSDVEELQTVIEEEESRLATLREKMAQESSKRERYKLENVRRKHNYLPLIMELLKLLAKRGELVPLVDKAKKKKQLQREQKEKTEAAK